MHAEASDDFIGLYDAAVDVWAACRDELEACIRLGLFVRQGGSSGGAAAQAKADKMQALMAKRRFYGAQQAFFRSLCTAAKIDTARSRARPAAACYAAAALFSAAL